MGRREDMVARAIELCVDDSHGYSWGDRWDVDRDCSSMMYDCADHAGYGVGTGPDETRYTGTMPDDFGAAGFACVDYGEVDPFPGCIFLRDPWGSGGHTEMYIGDGMTAGAHIAETGGVYGQPGDQTGHEISVEPDPGGWDYVLVPPDDEAPEPEQVLGEPTNDMGFRYRAHVQNLGWCDWAHDGQTAGTTGFSLRMEALQIDTPFGEVTVRAHIQDRGWVTYPPAKPGAPVTIGTTGQSLRLEKIIIEANGLPEGYRLEYRVHQQDVGWKAWTPAGYATGSDGQSMRLEAIQIRVVRDA